MKRYILTLLIGGLGIGALLNLLNVHIAFWKWIILCISVLFWGSLLEKAEQRWRQK